MSSGPKSKKPQNSAKTQTIIRSSSLDYQKKDNDLTYSGKVTVQSEGMFLSSASLKVIWDKDGKKVNRATANDNVVIRENGLECKGDTADWHLDSEIIVVVGNLVEVHDPKMGRSFTRRLTWSTADDTISFESQ